MSGALIYDELTSPEIKKLVDGGMEMAIMPTGATEQHGPHLPLSVDYLCAYRIALGVSAETGIPVFPALPYGHSGGHRGFPGTLSLRPETFQSVIEDIAEWAYATGFRRLLFLNGHLLNEASLANAVANLRGRFEDFKLAVITWWDITPELQAQFHADRNCGMGHGNVVETSLMRHFRDDLVRMEHARPAEGRREKYFFYYLIKQLSRVGYMGDPSRATPELGEKLYRMAVDGLVPRIRAALKEEPPHK